MQPYIRGYIDFRMPQQFVEEIDADGIDGGVVRVTQRHKGEPANPHVKHVFVMASAVRGDMVIRLTYPVGSTRGSEKDDPAILKKADQAEKDLVEKLHALGVEVRGGVVSAVMPAAA